MAQLAQRSTGNASESNGVHKKVPVRDGYVHTNICSKNV
jgi:hypothetical protein